MVNNTFFNNSAFEGGAIIYTKAKPHIVSNIFQNNKAYYGDKIASFPVRIKIRNKENETITFLNNIRPSNNYPIADGLIIEFLDEMRQKVNRTTIKGFIKIILFNFNYIY